MRRADVPLCLRINVPRAYARNSGRIAGEMGLTCDVCNLPEGQLSSSWMVGWREGSQTFAQRKGVISPRNLTLYQRMQEPDVRLATRRAFDLGLAGEGA